jgi:hypothetical protein
VESNAGRLEETLHPQPENYFPGKWTRDTSRKGYQLNKEVLVFVRQIRNEAPQPTDYGSTKTE